jgi:N-acetylglucosaminyl-diphospho-decaprenol L-rhamnosyltransferase
VHDVAAIVVSHRSAREAARAIASLRRGFSETGASGEVLLVDCGSGPDELSRLKEAGSDRLLAIDNRGYSGGVNAGVAAARARMLLFCNADVELSARALGPLLEAAGRPEVGAASPVQHADAEGRIFLPSGFGAGFARDLAQAVGGRWGADRRFARHAARQWRLWQEGGETDDLTGSILAVRREVVDRVGRLDERFPFEYEETEWEERVRRARLTLRVVAQARARHAAGTSAARNPETAIRRRASRREYRHRRYGRLGSAFLAWAERRSSPPGIVAPAPVVFEARGRDFAVAVSPNPSLLPFAAAGLEREVTAESLVSAAGTPLYARVFRVRDGMPEPVLRIGA